MQCQRCGSGVPEGSTQCHICFAPLNEPEPEQTSQAPAAGAAAPAQGIPGIPGVPAAGGLAAPAQAAEPEVRPSYMAPNQQMAPPPAPGGMGGGQTRVTLTGEVINIPAPPPPPPAPTAARPGGAPPPRAGAGPGGRPTPPSRGSGLRPAYEEYDPRDAGGNKVMNIVIGVIILIVIAVGGFWYYSNVMNGPAAATTKYLQAFKDKDWKTVYTLTELSDQQKRLLNAAGGTDDEKEARYAKGLDQISSFVTLKEFQVGSATVSGDTATVPVTVTFDGSFAQQVNSQTGGKVECHMVKVDGKWKLDATKSSVLGGGK